MRYYTTENTIGQEKKCIVFLLTASYREPFRTDHLRLFRAHQQLRPAADQEAEAVRSGLIPGTAEKRSSEKDTERMAQLRDQGVGLQTTKDG